MFLITALCVGSALFMNAKAQSPQASKVIPAPPIPVKADPKASTPSPGNTQPAGTNAAPKAQQPAGTKTTGTQGGSTQPQPGAGQKSSTGMEDGPKPQPAPQPIPPGRVGGQGASERQ